METHADLVEAIDPVSLTASAGPRQDGATHSSQSESGHCATTHRVDGSVLWLWVLGESLIPSAIPLALLRPGVVDRVYYVLHLALELSGQKRRVDGFFPISSREIDRAIGREYGKRVLDALVSGHFLTTDDTYVPGEKCRWYKVNPHLLQSRVPIAGQVAERLTKYWEGSNRQAIQAKPEHRSLWDSLQRLEVTEQALRSVRGSIPPHEHGRVMHLEMTWDKIRRRDWRFSYDKRTGRVFNNFTNCPKALRRLATLNGEQLVEIDIRNSQPTFLAGFYPSDSSERKRYVEVVRSGRFYESLNEACDRPRKATERDQIKKDVYTQVLFGPLNYAFPVWKAFKTLFPELAMLVDRKKRESWNSFPLDLQAKEASVIIGRVVPRLEVELPGVPFLTIHDSIACPRRYSECVKRVLADELKSVLGFAPSLHTNEQDA